MTKSLFRPAIVASVLSLLISTVASQSAAASSSTSATVTIATATTAPKAISTLGCYSTATPLIEEGSYTYQTSGYCQVQCANLNKPVMAITEGSTCYCGDELPATSYQVSSNNCDSPCNGFDQQNCGGNGYWQLYLTGLENDVPTAEESSSTTSSSSTATTTSSTNTPSSTTEQPSVITKAGQTIVVTASATATPEVQQKSGGGGSSKVGIAIGVVVGVIALAAIVAAAILFMRHRRNQAIEEEHRRNTAVTGFGAGGKAESLSSSQDQRLDPSVFSHGRQSIGSIADERDFSRRILQVRNPDRDSKASNMA